MAEQRESGFRFGRRLYVPAPAICASLRRLGETGHRSRQRTGSAGRRIEPPPAQSLAQFPDSARQDAGERRLIEQERTP